MSTQLQTAPAAPAPASPEAARPDPKDEPVSIFNRSPKFGDVVHDIYEPIIAKDGTTVGQRVKISYRAEAGAFCKVPRYIAELWMKQNPDRIVTADSVGAPKGHNPERVSILEKENVALTERLKNLEGLVEQLRGKSG